jgi:hypothetical protein
MTLPVYEPVVRQICGVDFVFTEYKEPLVQLTSPPGRPDLVPVKGYMRGTLPNALADGRLPCAFCDPSKRHRQGAHLHRDHDNLFDNLASHVRRHGMTAQEYREAIGLLRRTRLLSRRTRARLGRHLGARPHPPPSWLVSSEVTARATKTKRANAISDESLNKRGVCRDQILAVARKIAKDNGGVLASSDLIRAGLRSRALQAVGFANFGALAEEVGARQTRKRWSDAELLAAFRELAERLGRVPTEVELGPANGTASAMTYSRLGGLQETARRCGLPPRSPSHPLRADFAEGCELDILNQYAITGSALRVALAAHLTYGATTLVLAKYGVVPSHMASERRKAMEWAAVIAQRLAGTEEMTA